MSALEVVVWNPDEEKECPVQCGSNCTAEWLEVHIVYEKCGSLSRTQRELLEAEAKRDWKQYTKAYNQLRKLSMI